MFEDNRSHRLRRLVAELAECPRDDIDAILANLSPAARQRIENLLEEYYRTANEPVVERNTMAMDFDSLHLSPWLIERLSANDVSAQWKMTTHARNALRSCASELFPQEGSPQCVNSSTNPSLLTRIRMAWPLSRRGAR